MPEQNDLSAVIAGLAEGKSIDEIANGIAPGSDEDPEVPEQEPQEEDPVEPEDAEPSDPPEKPEEDWLSKLPPEAVAQYHRLLDQNRETENRYRSVLGKLQPLQKRLSELERSQQTRDIAPDNGPKEAAPELSAAQQALVDRWTKEFPDDAQAVQALIDAKLAGVKPAQVNIDELSEGLRERMMQELAPVFGEVQRLRAERGRQAIAELVPDFEEFEIAKDGQPKLAARFYAASPPTVQRLYESPDPRDNAAFYMLLKAHLGTSTSKPVPQVRQPKPSAEVRNVSRLPGRGEPLSEQEQYELVAQHLANGGTIPDL